MGLGGRSLRARLGSGLDRGLVINDPGLAYLSLFFLFFSCFS
ncbi:MAG: hypothetical protein ACTSU9_16735 [Promethearchaeota archaeon]